MNIQTPPSTDEIEATLGLGNQGRRRRLIGKAFWLVLALALVAGGAWWFMAARSTTATIDYQTQAAARTDLVVRVQATGNVQPTTQVDVSSEMSGVIRTVNVRNNSIVRKDDVLAELDVVRLNAQRNRVEASLAAAEARLADAKATAQERQLAYDRSSSLSRKGISSTQDLESARAALARSDAAVLAAEADIDVVKAELLMQETDISKTRILSPVNGIVLKRSAEPGQTVASSLQAPVLFTLAEDLARMQLEAKVDEADIGAVKPGNTATFTVDAYPGKSFPAQIDTIEFSPNVTDNVVTYTAVLTVDNSELLLRPGMTATAQIVTQDVQDALAVPNAALRYEPPRTDSSTSSFDITRIFMPRPPQFRAPARQVSSGERSVWVLENNVPRQVTVGVGVTDGKFTEITSGDLAEGAQVIVSSRESRK